MASQPFAERILRFMKTKGYKPARLEKLALAMGIGEEEQGGFHDACRALMRTGRILMSSGQALTLPPPPSRLTGTFRANPRGFGFVVPDDPNSHGDIYVPQEATGGAMTGDRVRISVQKRGKRQGSMLYEGSVAAILTRGQSRFVGELTINAGRWYVIPDGKTIHGPILVSDPTAKDGRSGDQVVVEITEYPTERAAARGAIVKVLGVRGRPDVDTQSIIEQYELPGEFSEEVLAAARQAVADYDARSEAADREDLTAETVVTIDPADARDFDDAISLSRHADGTTELGVHIADVAHFVREGTSLDIEARERANSIYLPRVVIPMLPEVLSNGICSLQEREPRLTKSVFITYDRQGRLLRTRFANSIISNTKRLTYEQASAILAGKSGRTSAKVVALVGDMEKLARVIQARRKRAGMLTLEFPESDLVFNEEGRVTDVVPADTSYSHTIIEMFMVEANEAVARLMHEKRVPCLRRIHDDPSDLSDGTLQKFVRALGQDLPGRANRFDLQDLLERVHGKPEAFAIHLAVLRSMQQAEYSPLEVGHYALASEHYCHFTSPIRRYPDLTVHRLLDLEVRGELRSATAIESIPHFGQLTELGSHCSSNERRAEAAERELRLVFILRLLEDQVGQSLAGVVTGVANVGVFVQLDRYLIEGLLRFDALPDDWWNVDAQAGAVIGERSGRQIRIGDRLQVVIARIHISTRQLDLALKPVSASSRGRQRTTASEETPRKHRGARKKKTGKGARRR